MQTFLVPKDAVRELLARVPPAAPGPNVDRPATP